MATTSLLPYHLWPSDEWVVDDPDQERTISLLKTFLGILNKLTRQNFEVLMQKIDSLPVDSEDRMRRLIDLVFEKAIDEPEFCVHYANLCKHLSSLSFEEDIDESVDNGPHDPVDFHSLLINRCHKEFELDVYSTIDIESRQTEVDECDDLFQRRKLVIRLDEDKRRARRRFKGLMRLLGELYKLDMIRTNVIIASADKLLNSCTEESLELLCTLLRTIGWKLEDEAHGNEQFSNYLGPFFPKLQGIARTIPLSNRMRFMIQDILDLRLRGWLEREQYEE